MWNFITFSPPYRTISFTIQAVVPTSFRDFQKQYLSLFNPDSPKPRISFIFPKQNTASTHSKIPPFAMDTGKMALMVNLCPSKIPPFQHMFPCTKTTLPNCKYQLKCSNTSAPRIFNPFGGFPSIMHGSTLDGWRGTLYELTVSRNSPSVRFKRPELKAGLFGGL